MTPMMAREGVQRVFVRVCKDSGFKLDMVRAAQLSAKVIGCSPLSIWMTMDTQTMSEIASGKHPTTKKW